MNALRLVGDGYQSDERNSSIVVTRTLAGAFVFVSVGSRGSRIHEMNIICTRVEKRVHQIDGGKSIKG